MTLNNPKFCQLCGAEDGKAQQELADLKQLVGELIEISEPDGFRSADYMEWEVRVKQAIGVE